MLKNLKIRKKMLITISAANIFIFTVIFYFYLSYVKDIVEKETASHANSYLDEIVLELEGLLNEKGKISWTVNNNPRIIDWLATNKKRFIEPGEDPIYDFFTTYFEDLAKKDGEINSVFLSSELADMYFSTHSNRTVDPSYRVTKRPWYVKAKSAASLSYDVDADYTTGNILINIRQHIYDPNGKFLGIGGGRY